jgi:DNA polymerase III epsilon subunit-like protein
MFLRSSDTFQNNICIIFDTETTGLIPKKKTNNLEDTDISNFPYITQLSYILYDLEKNEIIGSYNTYIRIPDHIPVSDKITEITGITKEICQLKGIPIEDAIADFYNDYMKCGKIIAHNYTFDRDMILLEIFRNRNILQNYYPNISLMFNPDFMEAHHKYYECTMKLGTNICKLQNKNSPQNQNSSFVNKFNNYKWPKLEELHFHLFGSIPANLHNSLMDTLVCLRCYLKIKKNYTIANYDFSKMITKTIKIHDDYLREHILEQRVLLNYNN